jgi:hypothetical protein
VGVRSTLAAFLGLAGLALVACKPAVGSSCTKGEARCIDPGRALVCEAGKFIETPCAGKLGCRLQPEGTACDVHGNKAGDRCSKDEEGAAVCADSETLLVCRSGTTVRAACRGKDGCVEEHGRAACDASIAEAGDPCGAGSKSSCSVSGKEVLVCAGGAMKKTYECRGERGCTVASGKLDCDQTVAKLGDGCDRRLEGSVACSEDRKNIVKCALGRFVADEKCKAGTECLAEPGSIRCGKPDKV